MSMILIIVFLYVGVISLGFLVMLWGKQEGDSIFDKAYRLFGKISSGFSSILIVFTAY